MTLLQLESRDSKVKKKHNRNSETTSCAAVLTNQRHWDLLCDASSKGAAERKSSYSQTGCQISNTAPLEGPEGVQQKVETSLESTLQTKMYIKIKFTENKFSN